MGAVLGGVVQQQWQQHGSNAGRHFAAALQQLQQAWCIVPPAMSEPAAASHSLHIRGGRASFGRLQHGLHGAAACHCWSGLPHPHEAIGPRHTVGRCLHCRLTWPARPRPSCPQIVGEFGLRNKRELWRVQMVLSKLRARARDLLTLDEKDPK